MKHHHLYGQILATDISTLPLLPAKVHSPPAHVCHVVPALPTEPLTLIHTLHDFPGGPLLEVFLPDALLPGTPDRLRVRYGQPDGFKGGEFCLDLANHAITYAAGSVDDGTIAQVFERVVAPLYMLGGMPTLCALHGSAVMDRKRQGWCVVGPSGAGKSTTLGALCDQGARVLSDDLVVLDTQARQILPGSPTMRLWQQAHPLAVDSQPILGTRGKRWFRLSDEAGVSERVSCAGIIFLTPDPSSPGHGKFARLGPCVQTLQALLGQSFDFSAPPTWWQRRRFMAVTTLHRQIPLYTLSYARSPDGQPAHTPGLLERLEAL